MQPAGQWLLIAIFLVVMTGGAPISRAAVVNAAAVDAAAQGATLSMISPTACPNGGCAGGQRLNMRYDYIFSAYNPDSGSTNVKVCLYAPSSWGIGLDARESVVGVETGANYARSTHCDEDTIPPADYSLIMARETAFTQSRASDGIEAVFRLSRTASGTGRVVARLFEFSGSGIWTQTNPAATPLLSTAPSANPAYVANNAVVCENNNPCYINSGDDLPTGLGTGLKDAVDAAAAGTNIQVLGNYTIKTSTVLVNRPVIISGSNNSKLTFNGPGTCSGALLALNDAVTVRNLNIDDGVCSTPGRNLLEVNSTGSVLIESNTLINSDNAVLIRNNSGAVTVRYNHINGNAGYAVYAEGHSAGGALEMIGNNLHGNRTGAAVECSAAATGAVTNRRVNHNYWGPTAPTTQSTHCYISEGRHLGAPVTLKDETPGVNVKLVTVNETKTYAFEDQIAYRRSGGADFDLYIADHGYASPGGPPFTYAMGGESLGPCSNAFDVFLADGANPSGALELSIRYDKTSACQVTINSAQYCGQTTTPSLYPLHWYDPATNATRWWDTTGQRPENLTSGEGQATTCNIASNEIQVTIDSTGRPNLNNDLNYTPLMVGIPILKSFKPLASNQAVTINWTTNNETDVTGFYVLQSLDGTNFSPVTDLIQRTGSALQGRSYSIYKDKLTNGVTYHFRLQILRTDGIPVYSAIESVVVNVATITPTFTPSPTFTRTIPPPTVTPFPTMVFTQRPTAIATQTATVQIGTPSVTPYVFTSPEGTQDTEPIKDNEGDAYPPPETETPMGAYPPPDSAVDTPDGEPDSATASPTPVPTVVSGSSIPEQFAPWISLFLGMLSGSALLGAAGLWFFRLRK
jgi:hypothetical protein